MKISEHCHLIMAKYSKTFVYEIVDIPHNFELNKLKEFCKEIVAKESKYKVLPSIKSSSSDNKDDEFSFDNSEREDGNQEVDSCEGFILHLRSNADPNAAQKTYEVFENIFENMTIKINTSSMKDSPELNCSKSLRKKSSKERKQLSIRRIRKSFLSCSKQ